MRDRVPSFLIRFLPDVCESAEDIWRAGKVNALFAPVIISLVTADRSGTPFLRQFSVRCPCESFLPMLFLMIRNHPAERCLDMGATVDGFKIEFPVDAER
jgi:hypothetical protein